jgi:hypothetical protein
MLSKGIFSFFKAWRIVFTGMPASIRIPRFPVPM